VPVVPGQTAKHGRMSQSGHNRANRRGRGSSLVEYAAGAMGPLSSGEQRLRSGCPPGEIATVIGASPLLC
jgi:hypothetical protein